jgi:Uma2 family endonuclease
MTAALSYSIPEAAELLTRRLTGEEYDSLPENPRLELVDGILEFRETPNGRHQDVVDRLKAALVTVCPDGVRIVREQEVRIKHDHRRNPDLLAIAASAFDLDRSSYPPEDVLLAVEVVSPGSYTRDRKHKPIEYGEAGIPHFWRVEIWPHLAVHTHRLDGSDQYVRTGVFTPGDVTAVPGLPWAKIAVSDLDPE